MSQVLPSMQYICFRKSSRFEHGGAKLASCPGRHLTPLRPWLSHNLPSIKPTLRLPRANNDFLRPRVLSPSQLCLFLFETCPTPGNCRENCDATSGFCRWASSSWPSSTSGTTSTAGRSTATPTPTCTTWTSCSRRRRWDGASPVWRSAARFHVAAELRERGTWMRIIISRRNFRFKHRESLIRLMDGLSATSSILHMFICSVCKATQVTDSEAEDIFCDCLGSGKNRFEANVKHCWLTIIAYSTVVTDLTTLHFQLICISTQLICISVWLLFLRWCNVSLSPTLSSAMASCNYWRSPLQIWGLRLPAPKAAINQTCVWNWILDLFVKRSKRRFEWCCSAWARSNPGYGYRTFVCWL